MSVSVLVLLCRLDRLIHGLSYHTLQITMKYAKYAEDLQSMHKVCKICKVCRKYAVTLFSVSLYVYVLVLVFWCVSS